nr:EamA family transporter [Candidatus Phycorickettsia trachydisci]
MFFINTTKLNKKLILGFVALGSIQYGVTYITFVKAYLYIDKDIHYAILFLSMVPIHIALIGMVYEGKLSYVNLFTSVASFLSILLIYNDHLRFNSKILESFAFAQIANFCFAYGQVTYKRIQEKLPGVKDSDVFALMLLGALIVVMIATTVSGGWNFLAQVSHKQFGVIFYFGTVVSGVCMFLWNKGACKVTDGTLAVMNNFKIPLGVLVSTILFQQKTDLTKAIASLAIILICVFIQQRYEKNRIITDQYSSVKT